MVQVLCDTSGRLSGRGLMLEGGAMKSSIASAALTSLVGGMSAVATRLSQTSGCSPKRAQTETAATAVMS